MRTLEGQRILLIAPRFFGYDRDIVAALCARGAHVDRLADRPYDTPAMAAATRFAPRSILPFADRRYRRELETLRPARYDHVLVVNGQTVSRGFLRFLRGEFPNARFTLYMWDSLENRGRTVENFYLFDHLLSFDPLSAKQFGMQLRPLFYTHTAPPAGPETLRYDASFVGTVHSDRYAVISRMRDAFDPELRIFWYLYLQSSWLFTVYKRTQPGMRIARRADFRFTPLPKPEWRQIVEQSLAIIDIEHPRQRGLTMRTFETMGLSRKLITTNRHIRDYDFFDPDNLLVIDRQTPTFPRAFFETPYRPLPPAISYRYSIDGWIDEVLAT